MKKVIESLKNTFKYIVNVIYKFSSSFNKFRRASFLSLIILAIIFLLVQALDQAYTLLIDMIERGPFSLILCFVIISVFALVISHYPIYIYYAKDINDSKDENYWYVQKWLRIYSIFIYKTKPTRTATVLAVPKKKEYQQDYTAKYLRYTLGLFIFCIWHYYIHETFKPKLVYSEISMTVINMLKYFFYFMPFIVMGYMLHKKRKIEIENKDYQKKNNTKDNTLSYKKFNKSGEIFFLAILTVSVLLLLGIAFFGKFNCLTYLLLQILTFLLSVTYIYFRLFRSRINDSTAAPIIRLISIDFNYILFFFIIALGIFVLLVQSNLAVAFGWNHLNAMVILLAYIYLIYYTLACILKYLFAMQAIKRQSDEFNDGAINEQEYYDTLKYSSDGVSKIMSLQKQEGIVRRSKKIVAYGIGVIILFISLTLLFNERKVHELETKNTLNGTAVNIETYKTALEAKIQNKPLFFVASHGGALKANIWTMKVLNTIQNETNGDFLQQTASFSGASGGMMGLSMYSVLAGKYQNQYAKISERIDAVALKNFASSDISYTLGWDFIRKIFPLNKYAAPYKDRAYYSMVAYQNILEDTTRRTLDRNSFLSYWKKNIYDANGYFPALLVNTAKTNGRRGVFSSIAYGEENMFLNADNLSQLKNGEAVSFYQGVSCTNRFPGFSPAAKIKNYGHYIDAGAIDNSGLLTSLDWYDNLKNGKDPIIQPETNVIFVEIINGQTNYVKYLLEKFKDSTGIAFIKFDEREQGNLSAVISAGANLDKNPDYFSDLIKRLEQHGRKPASEVKDSIAAVINAKKFKVTHLPIYLPRVISIENVEAFIGGDIEDEDVRAQVEDFLKKENKKIYNITETDKCSWETYEPTLARHLSVSTLEYYRRVLDYDEDIKQNIERIKKLLSGIN